jgi:amino acid permease
MAKIYLAILFITMTAFIINGTVTDFSGTDFDDSVNNVLAYTTQAEQLFEQGFIAIFNTADTLVSSVNSFTSFLVGLTNPTFINPIAPTPEQIEQTTNIICTPYNEQNIIIQGTYQTRRAIYNLFNSPNLTIEQFYSLDRGLEFGIDWVQVCT